MPKFEKLEFMQGMFWKLCRKEKSKNQIGIPSRSQERTDELMMTLNNRINASKPEKYSGWLLLWNEYDLWLEVSTLTQQFTNTTFTTLLICANNVFIFFCRVLWTLALRTGSRQVKDGASWYDPGSKMGAWDMMENDQKCPPEHFPEHCLVYRERAKRSRKQKFMF